VTSLQIFKEVGDFVVGEYAAISTEFTRDALDTAGRR